MRIVTVASIFLTGFMVNASAQPKDMNTNHTVTLSGDVLRACIIAWSDFSQKIKGDLRSPDVAEPFITYISKLENYDVRITTDDKTNTVRFSPKATEEWRIFGGTATYTVRKSDSVVIDKMYDK